MVALRNERHFCKGNQSLCECSRGNANKIMEEILEEQKSACVAFFSSHICAKVGLLRNKILFIDLGLIITQIKPLSLQLVKVAFKKKTLMTIV